MSLRGPTVGRSKCDVSNLTDNPLNPTNLVTGRRSESPHRKDPRFPSDPAFPCGGRERFLHGRRHRSHNPLRTKKFRQFFGSTSYPQNCLVRPPFRASHPLPSALLHTPSPTPCGRDSPLPTTRSVATVPSYTRTVPTPRRYACPGPDVPPESASVPLSWSPRLVGASASVSDAGQRPSAASPPAATATSSTPHHLVFIVLDQLRPEFIDASTWRT